jgi:ABC-type Mn2+/Zn2+ transport system permease subunit
MAFLGDALAHIILPGVVLAFLLGLPVALGALVVSAGGAGDQRHQRPGEVSEDAAIGVVFAGALPWGGAALAATQLCGGPDPHPVRGPAGVSSADLWLMGALGALVLLVVVAFYKEFLVLSFDPL